MKKPSTNWLATFEQTGSLKEKSIKGGLATLVGQVSSFVINVGSTAIIARLVLPEDYGIIAMVVAFVGVFFIFKDIGFAQLIIQKTKLTQEELSSIFWVNIGVGGFISLVLLGLSPFVARFYEEPRLLPIALLFASIPVINSLFTVHSALLNRHMQFSSLSRILFLANFLAVVITIGMAYFGYGYWALTAMHIGTPIFSLIFFWWQCDWKPTPILVKTGMRENLNFGTYITGFNAINYFARNFDNILIGKFIGATALGIYSKAYQLLMLPISQIRDPITTVGLPALASLKSDKAAYRSYYLNLNFVLAFVSIPTIIVLLLISEPIILLVLGKEWVAAAAVFKIMAITALIQPIASTRGLVLLSLGETKKYFIWGVWNAVVVMIGFAIGVQYSIEWVAGSYAIANYLLLVPSLWYSFSNTHISVKDFFISIQYPMIFGITAGTIIYFVDTLSWSSNLWLSCFYTGLGFVLIYGIQWLILKGSRRKLTDVVDIIKTLKNAKK
ncbi:MAG: lipopolysaccharide biosynthesis protein [Schleiferiaceae bacterium]|nr:lipopolysaccharide biosynthesis protein [Schleiferiaceae bacterium]